MGSRDSLLIHTLCPDKINWSSGNITGDRPVSIAIIVSLGATAVVGFNVQPTYLGALADHLGFTAERLGPIAGLEIAARQVHTESKRGHGASKSHMPVRAARPKSRRSFPVQ